MEEFVRELEETGDYKSYNFTGHSLGGNLAMYGAIILKDPKKLGKVVTYNAPGFNSAFRVIFNEKIDRVKDKFTNYQNERDGVSESFVVPGKIVVLECDGWDILEVLGFNGHGLNMLVLDGNSGKFKKNRTGIKDATISGLVLRFVTANTDSYMLKLVPGLVVYDFWKWSNKKVSSIIKSIREKTSSANPIPQQIKLDTYKLKLYAQRIDSVNKRISKLDRRLDGLYWRVGLLGLWNLIQADALTGYSWRLKRCADYLNTTANNFDSVEKRLNNSL